MLECSGKSPSDSLVENVVHHAIIQSCSHPALAENQILEPDVITVLKYIPLWTGLLRPENKRSRDKVFQAFINSLISIVERLDLSVVTDEAGEEEGSEPDAASQGESIDLTLTQTMTEEGVPRSARPSVLPALERKATKVKDFTILVNLVDIATRVLDQCPDLVSPWLPKLWTSVSLWSYHHHDVSSFYKLANKLLALSFSGRLDPASEVYGLSQQFVQDHLLKCRSFDQAELRITAFRFVTTIPAQLVPSLMTLLPGVLEQVLEEGAGRPELGNAALKAVASYLEVYKEAEIDGVLRVVLPKLRRFLSYQRNSQEDVDLKRRSGKGRGKKKPKTDEQTTTQNYEEDNCEIATDILCKVGYFAGEKKFKPLFNTY